MPAEVLQVTAVPDGVHVPDGDITTVYPVTAALPVALGAVQDNVNVVVLVTGTIVKFVGAASTVPGTTAVDAEDAGLVPFAFVAVTAKV